MTALYLIGPPGSGKSTIMARLIARLGYDYGDEVHLCRETTITLLEGEGASAWMVGRMREKFPGTDALGLAASRYFREWIEANPDQLPELLLGEGTRLANIRFLLTLDAALPVQVALLYANEDVLQARCTARDGDLSAGFKKSRATQAFRLADQLEAVGIPLLRVDTSVQSAEATAGLLAESIN